MRTDTSINRIKASGFFFLPLPPAEAFELFTAEGERQWVPGWEPQILGEGPQEAGLVFLTEVDGATTIWTVLESNRAVLQHRYSRVTPGSHAGVVEVQLTGERTGTRVHVSYDMTALPGSRAEMLEAYAEPAFARMLQKWVELLSSWIEHSQTP